ncbi:S41 family peptidase [Mesoterricola silvestris]|uniref:Tricorn protease homolog n=1 Tax=Mesoterricola silvestris TaxID=2927979 RepID=A0AA48GNU9_9BACT|nr:S41 family peptidase [Mesoterricola silvestris]BDU71267.1 tricorn protease [Mesoterricola silvestris]
MRPLRLLLLTSAAAALVAQAPPLWLRYPAISPDGTSVAFSYQGDLYRVPATGGTATPLTVGGSYSSRPVWSHDGKWIAFASDRSGNLDVYVMPSQGGEARRLTWHSAADLPFAFTPDDKEVLFTSPRGHAAPDRQFPGRSFPETWLVSREGGRTRRLTDITLENAVYDPSGARILYQDVKGYEDPFRKHHTSAVTRDIWSFQPGSRAFTRLTSFKGEDREPAFGSDPDAFFFLSERDGSFNVFRGSVTHPDRAEAVTRFKTHPVRFLTAARNDTLCFGYDGEIWLQAPGAAARKLSVSVQVDGRGSLERVLPVNGSITEMKVSPTGKEIAFVVRGEIFVTSADGKVTRRITSLPGQERSVGFSPDGRTLVYAAERDGSWDVFTKRIVRKEEPSFFASTQLEEKAVAATKADEFQPLFSPDGKEVAYLEERTSIKVADLATGKTRTLLPEGRNYSYADGDQEYQWSPDGKWIVYACSRGLGWLRDIALMPADGSGPARNISHSGFGNGDPRFARNGSMIYWTSSREGSLNAAQQGVTRDVFGLFLTRKAWDRFNLSKEDFALVKEKEEAEEKEKAKEKTKDAKPKPEPVAIEWNGLDDRLARLSSHSTSLADFEVARALDKMYYLARFEKGYDLWSVDLRTRENKLILKLGAQRAGLEATPDGKALFLLADGKLVKVDPETSKREDLPAASELMQDPAAERAYIFNHVWRQVEKKFYVTDLHGVDWTKYREAYRRFLPSVRNNYDFQELLSEMLGELNASHTGARYNAPQVNTPATASLGLFLEPAPKGLKVAEVLKGGPLDLDASKVRAGQVLTAIDGVPVEDPEGVARLLNRRAGQNTLLTFEDAGAAFDEAVKPIPAGRENELLYLRWVEANRAETERLSKGRLGYVHVRSMDDASMRTVVDEALGRHSGKEALVVDTRFNGGGNIHEQLSDFLSGRKYFDIIPRGLPYGHEPLLKWVKPSIVLMSEGNYSDAHLFPVAYKLKGLGSTVGKPVPGTGTFVWWEAQIDPTLVFGIPQGGWRTPDGKFCENNQLEPDIDVANEPAAMSGGRDQQLEAAVAALVAQLEAKGK